MALSVDEKIALSKNRLEKAERFLEDAKILLNEKRWDRL